MNPTPRILGLDFTKGVLVLIMVLYHWTNYFVKSDDSTFRYLRFLTPSFIFIAGFLVAQIYVPRLRQGGRGIPARLAWRGGKLLALVGLLDLASMARGEAHSVSGFFLGTTPVAFSILVPIAYLLLSSAVILLLCPRIPWAFHLATGVLVAVAWVCEWTGQGNAYLEMLSIGLLGASCGHVPVPRLDRALHPAGLAAGYGLYAYAVQLWNVPYLVQIAGVAVNLGVLYWLGERSGNNSLTAVLAKLGSYSLFAYIAQIAILQALRAGLRGAPAAALLLACVGTVASVEILDRMRRRASGVNQVYSAVFS